MNEVTIVSLYGYWHLHRCLEGRHFFGHSDHRIGLSVRELPEDEALSKTKNLETMEVAEAKYDFKSNPYTQGQIESFGKLTIEQLERWVARGT